MDHDPQTPSKLKKFRDFKFLVKFDGLLKFKDSILKVNNLENNTH